MLNQKIRSLQVEARKNSLPQKSALTLIISEIDRLKGNKDPWTKTLQTGEPSDEVVIKVMEKMLRSELDRVQLGGIPDVVLQQTLNSLLPKIELLSEQDLRDWMVGNINFGELKSPLQAIGIVKKEFGDRTSVDLIKKVATQLKSDFTVRS